MNATPQNDLRHLFDGTHCLSKRQLRDYAASFSSSKASPMSREEAYAVESHLNTCPLCSAAVDGMLAHFPESADVLATVDAGFLKDHFKKHSPQIHLNTVAPAATAPVTRRIPGTGGARVIDLTALRTVGIAAAIVLLIGSLWWFQSRKEREQFGVNAPIAQAENSAAPSDGIAPTPGEERLARAGAAASEKEPDARDAAASLERSLAPASTALMDEKARTRPATEGFASPPPASPPAVAVNTPAGMAKDKADVARKSAPSATESKAIANVDAPARRYQRPLIEPSQPANRTVLTDKEIEKMPTRNPTDAASTTAGTYQKRDGGGTNIGGGRGENTTTVVDGIQQKADGKTLYKHGSYAAALKVFKQQMTSSSGAAREEATLYAARCHRALGQEAAAEKLLRSLADGTGPRARAARRELRGMDDADVAEPTRRSSRRAAPDAR